MRRWTSNNFFAPSLIFREPFDKFFDDPHLTLNRAAIEIYVALRLGGVYDSLGNQQERGSLDVMPWL
jgi:hypothetical protein